MAYEIVPMQYEDLERIYKPIDEQPLQMHVRSRARWRKDMFRSRWLVDKDLDIFLFWVPGDREYSKSRYVYGDARGVVVLREDAYCLYSILYASPSLMADLEATKTRMREAFRAAGVHIDGTTDESSPFAVPNAQFI